MAGNDNMKITQIGQKLDDFMNEMFNRFDRTDKKIDGIDTKISYTNGKVAQAMTDIALGQQQREQIISNCNKNHATKKEWVMWAWNGIQTIIIAILVWKITGR